MWAVTGAVRHAYPFSADHHMSPKAVRHADELKGDLEWEGEQADMQGSLMRCFVQLVREQHAQRAQLVGQGHSQALRLPFSASMPCCRYADTAHCQPQATV